MIHLICEIGCNWASIDTALKMIKEAKETANCWAVKFQLFNEETIKDSPIKDKLEPLILKEKDVKKLRKLAKLVGLQFILTPMYLDAVKLAGDYADYIKIRFKDHENQPLIDKALETGKTLFISVPHRPVSPQLMYNPRQRYFYCVPRYPPEPEDFNLEVASTCHGFSSHYPHTLFDLAFAINRFHEEAYIEKHVMISKFYRKKMDEQFEYIAQPIDHAVSVTFKELGEFIKQLKLIERMKRIRI